jgi:hypothetical protein
MAGTFVVRGKPGSELFLDFFPIRWRMAVQWLMKDSLNPTHRRPLPGQADR